MTALAQLKLTTVKGRGVISPVQMRRNKLIARLDEQVSMAQAMIDGRSYAPTRIRTIKDDETGERRSVEQAKRVKAWWWQGPKGLLLQIKYGTKTLMLAKTQNTIEVAAKTDLVPILEVVRKAVEAGELDGQLEAAGAKEK